MKPRPFIVSALLLSCAAAGALAQNAYYLAQVANGGFDGGSFRTTFVLFNNTDTDATALLELSDNDGAALAVVIEGLGTGSQFSVPLAAGATRILQTDGSGALVAGAARVTAPVKIGVSAIFTIYDSGGRYVTEAGVGHSEPLAEFVLPVDTTGMFNTGLALFNPGSGSAAVALTLRAADGRNAGQTTLDLGAKAHLASFVAGRDQLFPSIGSFQGTLRVQSSQPIAALVLRENRTPLSYTSLPVVPASSGKLTQNLAQVANGVFGGGSYRTSFLLFNLASAAAGVTISLTNDKGAPFSVTIPGKGAGSTFNLTLDPDAAVFLQTDGTGPLSAGAAVITSTVPVGAAGIFTVFDTQGAFQTEAGVGDSPVLSALTLPVDVTGAFNTGVAFFNPGSASMTLTLKLLDGNGSLHGSSATVDLPGKGQTAKFVTELFPGTANFRGSLAVAAPPGVAALTLRENSSRLSYTTLPVAEGFASGKPSVAPLLSTARTGLAVTGSLTIDETLPSGFLLSGQVGGPSQIGEVIARHGDGTMYYGQADPETGRYLIPVPAGNYSLRVCHQPAAAPGVVMTYSDPSPVQVSGDVTRDISIPAASLFSVAGSVSGLSSLPSTVGASVTFTSDDNTVEGAFELGAAGSYQGSLPNGGYRASVSVPSISFTGFQRESLALFNLGSARVSGGPVTKDLAIPAAARVSGTVRAGWLGPLAFGINVSARDRSAPPVADAACVLPPFESTASADAGGQYQMILALGRSFDLDVTVPLLVGSRRLGAVGFPVPARAAALDGDTLHDFNLPGLPDQVTITGRVTDSRGRAVKDVTVGAFTQAVTGAPGLSYSAAAVSDASGNYSLSVLSGTGYRLAFIPPAPTP